MTARAGILSRQTRRREQITRGHALPAARLPRRAQGQPGQHHTGDGNPAKAMSGEKDHRQRQRIRPTMLARLCLKGNGGIEPAPPAAPCRQLSDSSVRRASADTALSGGESVRCPGRPPPRRRVAGLRTLSWRADQTTRIRGTAFASVQRGFDGERRSDL